MKNMAVKIEETLTGLLGFLGLFAAIYGLVARYFLPHLGSDWAGELTIYFLLWGVWLSSGRLVFENGHVRSDLLGHFSGKIGINSGEIFHALVGMVFCAVMLWFSVDVVRLAWHLDERSDSRLRIPMVLYYLSISTGLSIMSIGYALRTARAVWALLRPLLSSGAD